jgi:hypothetical protein
MGVGPGSDSGRVERWRQNAGRSIERIPPGWHGVADRENLKGLPQLDDGRRRLGTELCHSTPTCHLSSGRGDD